MAITTIRAITTSTTAPKISPATYSGDEPEDEDGTVAPPTCAACSDATLIASALVKSPDTVKTKTRKTLSPSVNVTEYVFAGVPLAVVATEAYPFAPDTPGTRELGPMLAARKTRQNTRNLCRIAELEREDLYGIAVQRRMRPDTEIAGEITVGQLLSKNGGSRTELVNR